jgi:hypothetical protein
VVTVTTFDNSLEVIYLPFAPQHGDAFEANVIRGLGAFGSPSV